MAIKLASKVRALVVAFATSVVIALTFAASAYAYVGTFTGYPYDKCTDASVYHSPTTTCTAWTGGYPSGYVRSEQFSTNVYAIKLQTRDCTQLYPSVKCTAFSDLATLVLNNRPGYTASFRATRYGDYRTCYKLLSSSSWFCDNGTDEYLGD